MTRLLIYGMGKIGGETAYLAAVRGIADEIIIADAAKPFLDAQRLDLIHTGLDVMITDDLSLAGDADAAVFAAGFARTPQVKTRADLLGINVPVAREYCELLKKSGFSGVTIDITNPMDAVNYFICRESGLEREKCIGFGGQLDSARLKIFLNERGLKSDGAMALGEHGEFQVPVLSGIKGGENVSKEVREEILLQMRGASMPVIKGKGGTVFGPAYHISELVKAVVEDKRCMMPVSCILDGEYGLSGLSIGVPAEIGRDGIRKIHEISFDAWESEKFKAASEHLRDLCAKA